MKNNDQDDQNSREQASEHGGKVDIIPDGEELVQPKIPHGYRMRYLGIHRIVYPPPPLASFFFGPFRMRKQVKKLAGPIFSAGWFVQETYNINPWRATSAITLNTVAALASTAGLYLTNRMLSLVSVPHNSRLVSHHYRSRVD